MKRYAHLVLVLSVLALMALAACSKAASFEGAPPSFAGDKLMREEAPPSPQAEMAKSAAAPSAPGNSFAVPAGRKLIYTADLSIVAANPGDVAKIMDAELSNFGAYASSQNVYENVISYEIRVPVDKFGRLLDLLETLGKLRNKNVQARDVTEYYYDLENRVKNKQILVERYQTYLKNAKNVEDLLNVERFLNDATTELESLQGSFRGLVKQVEYATVSFTIEAEVRSGSGRPGLWEQLKNVFASFTSVLQTIVVVIVAIVVYGVPILLAVSLFWFLLFGRVGLVKKLYRLVAGEKKK